jgi:type III secretion protein J
MPTSISTECSPLFARKDWPSLKSCWRSLVACTLAIFLAACGSSVALLVDLTQADANDIVAALQREGVESEKSMTKTGVSVMVRESSLPAAVVVLRKNGLPRSSHARMGEVFKREGMISTPLEERARYLYAMSQELERTLSEMDGVIAARVHIVLPERPAPGAPLFPSSAAVYIKHYSDAGLEIQERRIRKMVAASIPGLSQASISKIPIIFEAIEKQISDDAMPKQKAGGWIGWIIFVLGMLGGAIAIWYYRDRLMALVAGLRKPKSTGQLVDGTTAT